ncbi:MAG: rhomboid family intramembrane serine protease [Gemmatimonadota bacterium]|nr:rhomboid family intramembrane serine protease [Gemmatimonadota bacterium]
MLMPIGDDDSRLRITPVVTFALIAANAAVFLLQLAHGDIESFFRTWAVIPSEYANATDAPPTHPGPFWITTVTSMFMHGGWMHIFGNMLFLWVFGDNVEEALGHVKFLLFYLVCGVLAALAQIAIDPASDIPSLGASGAISGILGAYVAMFPKQRVRVLIGRAVRHMPAVVVIGLWIAFQFVNGIGQLAQTEETGGVAYAAHIGGFVAGLALVWVFRIGSGGRSA